MQDTTKLLTLLNGDF